MIYDLNDYYKHTKTDITRIEVYSNNDTAERLLAYHKQNETLEMPLFDCINESESLLPMPVSLFPIIDKLIASAGQRVIVTGIDSYLSLIRDTDSFMIALQKRIDDGKMNVVYMLSESNFNDSVFQNPKYTNSMQIVYIGNADGYVQEPSISVVSGKWVEQGVNPANWRQLLKGMGQFKPSGEYTLVLNNGLIVQAGLSGNVRQITEITTIAHQFYLLPVHLSEPLLEKLIVASCNSGKSPDEYLVIQFGIDNLNTKMAIKRLFELRKDNLLDAYIWYVKKTIGENSYISYVLSENVKPEHLLSRYVCDAVLAVMGDSSLSAYIPDFANERVDAVKEMLNEAAQFMPMFIAQAKAYSDNQIAPWLNCGTDAERIEIVRRVSENDLSVGLPEIWKNKFSLLDDYLTCDYDYDTRELTAYFREYRRFKVTDMVSAEFVKKAFDYVLPGTFPLRDSVLQDLCTDESTALLVVDGMGAEYYPLLLALADRYSMNIESASVAAIKLPSSTKFNKIKWRNERVLDAIQGVDNVSHDGAEKHEATSPSQNIVATLSKFKSVISRVVKAFEKYNRVVVTADHGSSRLAVIAHEEEMNKTLLWEGEPTHSRYTLEIFGKQRPSELEPFYDVDKNITYWVVRGYNRLPKKGTVAVHGGASLEERLVPVVIFSKAKTEQIRKSVKSAAQIIEKIGFDDI